MCINNNSTDLDQTASVQSSCLFIWVKCHDFFSLDFAIFYQEETTLGLPACFFFQNKSSLKGRLCCDKNKSELQIRDGIEDYSKIIFLISQQKHML